MSLSHAETGLFDLVIGWSNVISAGIALVALVVSIGLGTAWAQAFWLTRVRWLTIGRPLRDLDPRLPRPLSNAMTGRKKLAGNVWEAILATDARRVWHVKFNRQTHQLMRRRVEVGQPRIVEELTWLSHLVFVEELEPTGSRTDPPAVPVAFLFNPHLTRSREGYPELVSQMYERYAATVRRRWLLRIATGRLAQEEYDCATGTSRLLADAGRYRVLEGGDSDNPVRGLWIDLASSWSTLVGAYSRRTRLLAWPESSQGTTSGGFASLTSSYVPFRVSVEGAPGARFSEGRRLYCLPADTAASTVDMRYDGIMSRLHGDPGYRVEMDQHSGRWRLHLCLSETTYSSFVRSQTLVNNPSGLGHLAYFSRLLSVNLLLLDHAGNVLLVKRHSGIAHPSRFAGAVSGACELVGRAGLSSDTDSDGFPDLFATCRREAKEELGIDTVSAGWHLSALGLIQVHDLRDVLTHVLVVTARVPGDVKEFRVVPGTTDDLEGTWELGDEAMVVSLRQALGNDACLAEFVHWVRQTKDLTSHGAGSLLLHAASHISRNEPAALSVLYDALIKPLDPAEIVERPSCVTTQPLWEG